MASKSSVFILYLSIFSSVFSARIIKRFDEVCTDQTSSSSKSFNYLLESKLINWKVKPAFDKGKFLGKGCFGEVRRADFPDTENSYKKIALKMTGFKSPQDKDQLLTEISVMKAFSKSTYAAKFYGCVTEGYSTVYLVQDLLDHNLGSTSFRDEIRTQTCSESLALYLQMFMGAKDLWEVGFTHNDIKPENMMADKYNKRAYLIDFGRAQLNTEYNKPLGTLIFMSPNKFRRGKPVKLIDDFYSIALSIAVVEAKGYYDDIFMKDGRSLPMSCVRMGMDSSCLAAMKENARRVLKKAGYGDYISGSSKSTINFTTLIAKLIGYQTFTFTPDEVIEIMNRLIKEHTAAKLLDEEEKAAIQKDREVRNQLRKALKEDYQDEDENFKRQPGLIKPNQPERKKPTDQEIELRHKERLAKLAALERHENRAREDSLIFKDHKDFFEKLSDEDIDKEGEMAGIKVVGKDENKNVEILSPFDHPLNKFNPKEEIVARRPVVLQEDKFGQNVNQGKGRLDILKVEKQKEERSVGKQVQPEFRAPFWPNDFAKDGQNNPKFRAIDKLPVERADQKLLGKNQQFDDLKRKDSPIDFGRLDGMNFRPLRIKVVDQRNPNENRFPDPNFKLI